MVSSERTAAHRGEAPGGAAVQLQLRRAAAPDDLDVAPEHAVRVAGAERLHRRFLRGEAAGEMNRRLPPPRAVRDLAFGEDAVQEARRRTARSSLTMRGMSVASMPRPMMFGMIRIDDCPQPSGGFEWVQARRRPGARLPRRSSRSPLTSLRRAPGRWGPARRRPDDDVASRSAASLGVDAAQPRAALRQVHGAAVVVRRAGDRRRRLQPLPEADIVVVERSGARRSRFRRPTACRCSIADRRTGAVAAAHAGWRGPGRRRAAASTVAALAREFGSRPADLVAAVGPSIGACCYEVGADVRDAFAAAGSPTRARPVVLRRAAADRRAIRRCRACAPRRAPITGSSTAGRRRAISSRRRACPREQIHGAELCTASHPRAVLLVSPRRQRRPAGWRPRSRRLQGLRPASSIAALASRSACALSARPTCSKVTRPISCASRRALACSGCSPAFFTL